MDLSNKIDLILALAKLRGDSSGQPFLWWYRGEQYAIQDMTAKVLWAVEGAQIGRFARNSDGSWAHTFRDVMFYKDAESGERLRQFKNEATGATVAPPVMRMGPFTVATSADGSIFNQPAQLPPGMEASWRVEPPIVRGDDLYVRETGTTRIAKPGKDAAPAAQRYHHINDFLTHYGRVSYVMDPKVTKAPARQHFQSCNDWTPWLKMGDTPGFIMGRGVGTKLTDISELPKHLLDWIKADEPEFLKDPELAPWDKAYDPVHQERPK
jgi:hypothetical protein